MRAGACGKSEAVFTDSKQDTGLFVSCQSYRTQIELASAVHGAGGGGDRARCGSQAQAVAGGPIGVSGDGKDEDEFTAVGVVIAGEREFLPDEQAEGVALLEETFLGDLGATPAGEEVEVGIAGEFEERTIGFGGMGGL